MHEFRSTFISKAFLRSVWALDYEAFKGSATERDLEERLKRWSERKDLKETSAEAAFIDVFFRDTWGYVQSGQPGSENEFTLYPKFALSGSGAKGGSGEADLAIGVFSKDTPSLVAQVLCEFKDIRSALDAPQKRKGNTRSPVKQCLDYLNAARRGLFGNEAIVPTWAIVTDMNEFRLYWYDRAPQQYLYFTIQPTDLFQGESLLAQTEEARFDRFLFRTIFHKDTLITSGGRALLLTLISQQKFRDRELENAFYAEYRKFREKLYLTLLENNPESTRRFPGTRGHLVRLAQKILDRCIFIFFCEDMGQALAFPPKLLRDFLMARANDAYYDPKGTTIWQELLNLFRAMNDGTAFGGKAINQFNGGLFASDEKLERLHVPNSIFCQQGQGQNEASIHAYKETLLYLAASYNYASGWSQGLTKPAESIGLYILGRIFEQSITELEILEAEADGRPSVNKESKRKRDGVYYTPEWVVERIVAETIGVRLDEIKRQCGWPKNGLPNVKLIDAFTERLKTFTVLDPACGSGAFLITALRYLVDTWHEVQAIRRQVTGGKIANDDAALIRDILKSNIYGVDINPASIEIARLALWLHTARGDKPLSALESTIRDGNSLIDNNFYKGQISLGLYDANEKERVNAFDWEEKFPEVFERGGFDAIVGNPPYVKLQNFKRVHTDMADYLRLDGLGNPTYRSTQTGNFDLYLPFIEKGIELLNEDGRLGYIAPSLWSVNEYGEGLRELVAKNRTLDRWLDFKAFQVFEESTTYTALQFFTKTPNDAVKVAFSEDGIISENPWENDECTLSYNRLKFGDRWLLLTGPEREVIDRIYLRCKQLDDASLTKNIYQGLITSADSIYHLERIGPKKYMSYPKDDDASHVPYEVEIEDELMHPLVSGADAARYVEPNPRTFILFPYRHEGKVMRIINAEALSRQYPKAWKYLHSYEKQLRLREVKKDKKGKIIEAPFDDDQWYRFGRHQNIDKQDVEKIIVPRIVAKLACSVDLKGKFYLDNVDVGGIEVADGVDPFFLACLINSPLLDFIFRRISKPFRGNYYSANKQFIAPLPIPKATENQRVEISKQGKILQKAHSQKHELLKRLATRLETSQLKTRPETWLFPNLRNKKELEKDAPKQLDPIAKKEWIDQRYEQNLESIYDAISTRLTPEAKLSAAFKSGELSFSINGIVIVDHIFVDEAEGKFILAQWNLIAQTLPITDATTGKNLCNALRRLATTDNSALVKQIIDLEKELSSMETDIHQQESQTNALIYFLYGLNDDEVKLVERG